MAEQTLAVMERFNAALERHDIEGMLAEMAEDTIFENTSPAPDGTRLEGIDAMRTFFTELFETNPGTRFDIEEQFVAGDHCVVRWRYDWGNGHVRGVDVIRLREGRIAETYSYVKGQVRARSSTHLRAWRLCDRMGGSEGGIVKRVGLAAIRLGTAVPRLAWAVDPPRGGFGLV